MEGGEGNQLSRSGENFPPALPRFPVEMKLGRVLWGRMEREHQEEAKKEGGKERQQDGEFFCEMAPEIPAGVESCLQQSEGQLELAT